MVKFFTNTVFQYLASVIIASGVALNLYLAKQEGVLYLTLLLIPFALIILIFRKE